LIAVVFREVRIGIEVIAVSRVSSTIFWFAFAVVISEIKNKTYNSQKSVDKLLMEIDETKGGLQYSIVL